MSDQVAAAIDQVDPWWHDELIRFCRGEPVSAAFEAYRDSDPACRHATDLVTRQMYLCSNDPPEDGNELHPLFVLWLGCAMGVLGALGYLYLTSRVNG